MIYNLKLEVIELLEKIQGVSFNAFKIHDRDPSLEMWDYISADGVEFYIANLAETPYFDRLYECMQLLKECSFTKNALAQEKLGFDRFLTDLQEKN